MTTSNIPWVNKGAIYQYVYRIGLWGSSAYLFWTAWVLYASEEMSRHPLLVLLLFALVALAFISAILGSRPSNIRRYLPLIPTTLIIAIIIQYGLQIAAFPTNPLMTDSFILADYAAELVLLGINPYTWDYSSAFSDYQALPYFSTPLLTGDEVSNLPYPALSFLIYIPFKLLNIVETRFIFVLALIALLLVFYRLSPDPWHALTPLLLVVYPGYLAWSLGFVIDAFWVLMLLAMVAAWQWRTGRAVLYGLACAFKQQPWLLAPFLLLRLWLDEADPDPSPTWQRVTRFIFVSGGTFLLWNAPFAWLDFPVWLRGVFSPLGDPLIYFGQGLSTVTQFGWLPLAKDFYTTLTLLVLVTLILLYTTNFSRIKETMWLFPAIFMWFSYRSLQSYFVFWPLLVVMVIVMQRENSPSYTLRWHKATPVIIIGALVGFTACLAYFATPTPISVSLVSGDALNLQFINRLEIDISNNSEKALTPSIAVMSAFHQPFSWEISSGPPTLEPGETAVYQATTDLPYRWVHLKEGAQVVVTDGGGDYHLRGSLFIPPDPSLRENTGIYNTSYIMNENVPSGWLLNGSSDVKTAVSANSSSPTPAITLSLEPVVSASGWVSATLGQSIPFPFADISAWLSPPALASTPTAASPLVYGLEFDDGQHRLWLLYGGEAEEGNLAPDHAYISYPASPETWHAYTFNLADIYKKFGWSPPSPQRLVRGNLDYLTPTVTIRLLLAARNPSSALLGAQFGTLTVADASNDTRHRQIMATLLQEADYNLVLGDLAQDRRNYEVAQRHYQRALAEDPTLAAAHAGMGWSTRHLEGCTAALPYFQQAVALEPQLTTAVDGLTLCTEVAP